MLGLGGCRPQTTDRSDANKPPADPNRREPPDGVDLGLLPMSDELNTIWTIHCNRQAGIISGSGSGSRPGPTDPDPWGDPADPAAESWDQSVDLPGTRRHVCHCRRPMASSYSFPNR